VITQASVEESSSREFGREDHIYQITQHNTAKPLASAPIHTISHKQTPQRKPCSNKRQVRVRPTDQRIPGIARQGESPSKASHAERKDK